MKIGNREVVLGFIVLFMGLVGGQWLLVLANAAEPSAGQHQQEYELIKTQFDMACKNDEHHSQSKLGFLSTLQEQVSRKVDRNHERLKRAQDFLSDPEKPYRERMRRELASAKEAHSLSADRYEYALMKPKPKPNEFESRRLELRSAREELLRRQAVAAGPTPDLSPQVAVVMTEAKDLYEANKKYARLQVDLRHCVTMSTLNGWVRKEDLPERVAGKDGNFGDPAGMYSKGGGSSSAYSSSSTLSSGSGGDAASGAQ